MVRDSIKRRIRKSASAYRTISEVSEEIDVPAHVLRFWESKFPSLEPMKRGGGRRYYKPEDVEALRRIRALLYRDGFTIRGVQQLLKSHGGKPPSGVAAAGDKVEVVEAPAVSLKSDIPPEVGQPQLDFGLSSRQIDRLKSVLLELKSMRSDLIKELR
ncbi:MAG: MerR family transcriptional regulator [Alphaproteobacteria bacterium]|jgi:DNA-binding transcriptional MerR regulator